jgi:hypothetical protein
MKGLRVKWIGSLTSWVIVLCTSVTASAQQETAPQNGQRDIPGDAPDRRDEVAARKRWIGALEGVTHAPIDVGVQATLQMPIGLRVVTSYGWMPTAYADVLTNVARGWSNDARARALLDGLAINGRVWRLGAGVHPFKNVGLYLDAGYARASLDGTLALASAEALELAGVEDAGTVSSRLNLWFFELGYQAQIADRAVLALGMGMMGTIDSRTSIAGTGNSTVEAALSESEILLDDTFETYGFVPTLTVRAGLDLI